MLIAPMIMGAYFHSSAQSNFKESSNQFALFTQTGELKNLDNAKKFIDQIYKTRRDSTSIRVNELRAMIYSSLAYADSLRTLSYEQDPIQSTYVSLEKLKQRNHQINKGELSYINQNLAAAHVFRANKALEKMEYNDAYAQFKYVNKINPNNTDILNNLALLAFKANDLDESERYYKQLIDKDSYSDKHILQLAEIYKRKNDPHEELEILKKGKSLFPDSKEIIFKLIELYADNNNYPAVVEIIDEAIKFEPENIELNYLAGYANENLQNLDIATHYFEKVISLDRNNYAANLALGLLELDKFLKDEDNLQAQYNAQEYLLKANEIKPYEISALKSLAIYYENTDNDLQLDRVNLLLNQLTNKY